MEHLHIHCMFNDVVRVNPTYVVTNSHAKKLQGDVLINEIIWEDETAVFFLLPALTFTVYMYTCIIQLNLLKATYLKYQDPVVSHGGYSHLQELR